MLCCDTRSPPCPFTFPPPPGDAQGREMRHLNNNQSPQPTHSCQWFINRLAPMRSENWHTLHIDEAWYSHRSSMFIFGRRLVAVLAVTHQLIPVRVDLSLNLLLAESRTKTNRRAINHKKQFKFDEDFHHRDVNTQSWIISIDSDGVSQLCEPQRSFHEPGIDFNGNFCSVMFLLFLSFRVDRKIYDSFACINCGKPSTHASTYSMKVETMTG